jgi:hypothetical protein
MSTHSLETDLKTLTAIKEARAFYVPPQIGLLELKEPIAIAFYTIKRQITLMP